LAAFSISGLASAGAALDHKGQQAVLAWIGFLQQFDLGGERSTFLAKGNSSSPHMETEPKAGRLVHISVFDQKPGSIIVSGNARMALRLSSRQDAVIR